MKTAIAAAAALTLLAACKPTGEPAPRAPAADPAVSAPQAPAATPVRYFYFGNHVPRAQIVSIDGIDTASARLVGQTMAEDNYAYCMGSFGAGNAEAIAGCADQRTAPPQDEMTADCIARTVSDGSSAAWVRDEEAEDGKVMPVWQDKDSGDIRDYSGAGGGYVLTAAFRLMCPAASTNIAPDPD